MRVPPSVNLALVLAWALTPATVAAQDDESDVRRHKVTAQFGVVSPLADTLRATDVSVTADGRVGLANLAYRYAFSSRLEVGVELRYWIGRWATPPTGQLKVAGGFIGPGVRFNLRDTHRASEQRTLVPYVMGNAYLVEQQLTTTTTNIHTRSHTAIDYGYGVGIGGGVDIQAGRRIAIPIEVTYVRAYGSDIQDLSAVGVAVGITLRF